MIILTLVL